MSTRKEYLIRLEVDVTLKVPVFWTPDDFEGSDLTWKKFVDKMFANEAYVKEQIADNLRDSDASDFFDTDDKFDVTVRLIKPKEIEK